MNILYIHTNIVSDMDVVSSLQQSEHMIQELKAPDTNGDMEYAAELLSIIEEQSVDMVIALRYFPVVSIACNAIKVKYISWICSSYDPNIYSYTLLNECNYIFFADYTLYQEFEKNGFKKIFYLPLAVNAGRIQRILTSEKSIKNNSIDILMVQDILTREEMSYHPLSPGSPLKDASKGYLEGCIACQHQLSGLPSMAEHLPVYVREDLEKHFIPEINPDSVETKSHYYDYRYFNNLITYADRDIHLNVWAKNKHVKRVDLYGKGKKYQAEEIYCHRQVGYLIELPLIIRQAKINFVVTHRNWKSAIPQISWDIMACGGFLLSNIQEDFFRVFLEEIPVLYRNERDMLSKGIYYLNHDKERQSLSERISQEVCGKHTYQHRIKEIFMKI